MIEQFYSWTHTHEKELKTESWEDTCIPEFTVVLLIIVKRWKQSKSPLIH
jgi:hypothetical protein